MAVGAVATAVIINSGDSASTKATVGPGPRPVTSAPRTTTPPSASASPAPSTSRAPQSPETVTTLAPPVAAAPPGPITAAPLPTYLPPRALAPTPQPPGATLSPRTVFYSVAGTKQLLDLVNIVYTDAQGFPKTEFNVSLPWTKMVVLNPGVTTESVIAQSIYSHLNCSVVNAEGQVVVSSTNNSTMATCTR